jgi:hypothetical protein
VRQNGILGGGNALLPAAGTPMLNPKARDAGGGCFKAFFGLFKSFCPFPCDRRKVWPRGTESMARWKESVAQRYRKYGQMERKCGPEVRKTCPLYFCSTLSFDQATLSAPLFHTSDLAILSAPLFHTFDLATLAVHLFHSFFRSSHTFCTSVPHL